MRELSRAAMAVLILCGLCGAETARELRLSDARIVLNMPDKLDPAKQSLLIIYTCPNGNTIEQTLGAKLEPGMDWHYDIQHVAAQVRKLRQIDRDRNIVLACAEADNKSWPGWRKQRGAENGRIIRGIVDEVSRAVPGPVSIALAGHSGGGSFIFGYLNGGDAIADNVERIIWIDANYAYDDAERHGDKLLAWLKGGANRHLIVMAYNDRDVTLNGKKIVSATGGTYYRSHKMIDRLRDEAKLVGSKFGVFEEFNGMNGQVRFLIHTNPESKILHTVLVERNGLLEAMAWNTPLHGQWGGEFWGERAYADLITAMTLPATHSTTTKAATRPANAMGGKMLAETIADLPAKAREAAVVAEILKGNIPPFLRNFHPIRVKEGGHEIAYEVMPDYLAIGSDDDFVRMPMTPASATQIAQAMDCSLPTRKIVNDIYAQAELKVEPRPLTQEREAVRTFVQHNGIIEEQRAGKKLGLLMAGHKKDVVISNRLKEKPNKVAIYGWHKLDGKPIQPLYVGHVDWYVDYSHGIRLVKNKCVVDGKETTIQRVLRDPELCGLISDEGPIDASY